MSRPSIESDLIRVLDLIAVILVKRSLSRFFRYAKSSISVVTSRSLSQSDSMPTAAKSSSVDLNSCGPEVILKTRQRRNDRSPCLSQSIVECAKQWPHSRTLRYSVEQWVNSQSALEFCPIHCPNGRLGQDLGFGGIVFSLKLPELLNRNLAAVRAKLGQRFCFPNGPQIWCPIGQ